MALVIDCKYVELQSGQSRENDTFKQRGKQKMYALNKTVIQNKGEEVCWKY